MLKRTITYTTFDGVDITKDFWFNLTPREIITWEFEENLSGGVSGLIQDATTSNDGKKIMSLFERLMFKSIGERRGDAFIKSTEMSEKFLGSPAYEVLFFDLVTNPDYAAEFIKQTLPNEADVDRMRRQMAQNASGKSASEIARERFAPKDHQASHITDVQTVEEPHPEAYRADPDEGVKEDGAPEIGDDLLDSLIRSRSVAEITSYPGETYPRVITKDGKVFKLASFQQAQTVVTYLEQYGLR